MLDRAEEFRGDEIINQWYVAAALVDAEEEVWDFRGHFHIDGTGDGGSAIWLREIGGKNMALWKDGTVDGVDKDIGDWISPDTALKNREGRKEKAEKLHAACHCGGVEFWIEKPRDESAVTGLDETMTPADRSKWYALNDVCDSCRLITSSAITPWTFIEISHITLPNDEPYKGPVFGTGKAYQSSRSVTRVFCDTCGATVFFTCRAEVEKGRDRYVDLAVGLLRGAEIGEGVRCEGWLEWRTHRAAWEEDCKWKGLLEGLRKGMKGEE